MDIPLLKELLEIDESSWLDRLYFFDFSAVSSRRWDYVRRLYLVLVSNVLRGRLTWQFFTRNRSVIPVLQHRLLCEYQPCFINTLTICQLSHNAQRSAIAAEYIIIIFDIQIFKRELLRPDSFLESLLVCKIQESACFHDRWNNIPHLNHFSLVKSKKMRASTTVRMTFFIWIIIGLQNPRKCVLLGLLEWYITCDPHHRSSSLNSLKIH